MISKLLSLAALQSFLLCLFFVLSRPLRVYHIILSLFAFVVSILCFFQASESIAFYLRHPHLIRADWGMMLLLWPLFYLFIKVFLSDSFSLKVWIHFIPYIVNLLILTPFYLQPAESKIEIINYYTPFITQGFLGYSDYYKLLSVGIGIQSVFYSVKIIRLVRAYKDSIKILFSDLSGIHTSWFYLAVYGMAGLSSLYILSLFLNLTTSYIDHDYHQYFFLGLFIFILVLSYRSFYLPPAIQPIKIHKTPEASNLPNEVSVGINIEQSSKQISKLPNELIRLFEEEKLFLSPTLNAMEVAAKLGTSRQILSLVLNRGLSINFYDFVNSYRIKEFQFKLASKKFDHMSLLGLAFECGFNSKSTFNAVFKDVTGLTPSMYAESIKNSSRNSIRREGRSGSMEEEK